MAPLPSLPLARCGPAPEGLDTPPKAWTRLDPAPSPFGSLEAPVAPPTEARAPAANTGTKERLVPSFVSATVNPG